MNKFKAILVLFVFGFACIASSDQKAQDYLQELTKNLYLLDAKPGFRAHVLNEMLPYSKSLDDFSDADRAAFAIGLVQTLARNQDTSAEGLALAERLARSKKTDLMTRQRAAEWLISETNDLENPSLFAERLQLGIEIGGEKKQFYQEKLRELTFRQTVKEIAAQAKSDPDKADKRVAALLDELSDEQKRTLLVEVYQTWQISLPLTATKLMKGCFPTLDEQQCVTFSLAGLNDKMFGSNSQLPKELMDNREQIVQTLLKDQPPLKRHWMLTIFTQNNSIPDAERARWVKQLIKLHDLKSVDQETKQYLKTHLAYYYSALLGTVLGTPAFEKEYATYRSWLAELGEKEEPTMEVSDQFGRYTVRPDEYPNRKPQDWLRTRVGQITVAISAAILMVLIAVGTMFYRNRKQFKRS